MLEEHAGRMEQQVRSYSSIVASTRSLVEGKESIMDRKFELKELTAQPVLSVRSPGQPRRVPGGPAALALPR
jgi:hypothetical protein